MMVWLELAAEIRCQILKHVAENYQYSPEQPLLRVGYTMVCREWQGVFESWNFQQLILDQDDLLKFEEYMGKEKEYRRSYLEHLFLRIRLPEYDCTVCMTKESIDEAENNNRILSKAVWSLLSSLSEWNSLAQIGYFRRQQGLTLELGVYSPSDCKHRFKHLEFEHKFGYHEKITLEKRPGLGNGYCPDHEIDSTSRTVSEPEKRVSGVLELEFRSSEWLTEKLPEMDSLQRQQHLVNRDWQARGPTERTSSEVEADSQGKSASGGHGIPLAEASLPKVKIVEKFLLRRQFYRQISPKSLAKLFCAFDRLICFHHEKLPEFGQASSMY